jgi:hypothetical protein
MITKECPKCNSHMNEQEGEYALLNGTDVPAFGSKAEIMVTPRASQRMRVYKCENPACRFIEFYAS